jgi:hypothetical protein
LISEFFVFRPRRGLQRAQAKGVELRGSEKMDLVGNLMPPPYPQPSIHVWSSRD